MKTPRFLPLHQAFLGILGRIGQVGFQIGIEGGLGILPRPDSQSEIMRHAKNPSPGVLDFLAFLQCGVQPQKRFLGPLLRLRGVKTKS